jgi:2-polyprenyl-3-methyl-5-hydroxy-6-metoxy-1,4-benzoquinol methylase
MTDLIPNEMCVGLPPTPQHSIDAIEGWVSKLPANLNVKAGEAELFTDSRATWALQCVCGVEGKTILELGPLEGGHSYMLDRAGAKSVTAIEANKRCFIKCLIAKELLGMKSVNFLLGDFMPWLEAEHPRYDLVWATGVLYHMMDPTRLLQLIADCTDKVHIFTHYVLDDGYDSSMPWAETITHVEHRTIAGRIVPHYIKTYLETPRTVGFCGGVYPEAAWLRRADILDELGRLGFNRIDIAFESPHHPNGPCLELVAQR